MVVWSLTKVGMEERKSLLLVMRVFHHSLRLILPAVMCLLPCLLRRPFPTSELSLICVPLLTSANSTQHFS